jgi:hypothetical protein
MLGRELCEFAHSELLEFVAGEAFEIKSIGSLVQSKITDFFCVDLSTAPDAPIQRYC